MNSITPGVDFTQRIRELATATTSTAALNNGDTIPANTNRQAVPMPEVAPRPGASDWCQVGNSVFDGDYVVLRNKAWDGITVSHQGVDVRGNHNHEGSLQYVNRLDSEYSWCIRKVVFNAEIKAFVLPNLKPRAQRDPISKSDFVVFIATNSVDYVMGTENPPHIGSNGDYQVRLIHYALVTTNQLTTASAAEKARRLLSFGLWNSEKHSTYFLAQSRCIWTFHNIGSSNDQRLTFGGAAFNIRNIWTEIRAKETRIWESAGVLGPQILVNQIASIIHRTYNGGRNLTQAAGSDGAVVKLALHNDDTDDKAGWIVDGWKGKYYPVQRVLLPTEKPPAPPPLPPAQVEPQRPIPQLTETILHPPSQYVPGLTYDPETCTQRTTKLEQDSQGQDHREWWEKLIFRLIGVNWGDLDYLQQALVIGAATLIVIAAVEVGIKSVI